ncbi:MAG: hypothetical protein JWQ81_3518 [Amycolatopsis sp.]|uniref:hypothetical protein n=1 Tax=Amycolatopsis sp. TaxID=37632 RepID=UPI002639A5BE|nr:hypothetical protein [Amycolatopsis sp.]MCU1682779.1 hypothetical protein [Amycolatopsis sp.]
MTEIPVVTAVTRISASVEDMWRVLVAFDQYAQWHPVLSPDATPEQAVTGRRFRADARTATSLTRTPR